MVYKVLNNVVLSRAKNLAASNFGRLRQTTVKSEIDFSHSNMYTLSKTLCSLHAAITICSYRSNMESHRYTFTKTQPWKRIISNTLQR
jgi:hypothetical protein